MTILPRNGHQPVPSRPGAAPAAPRLSLLALALLIQAGAVDSLAADFERRTVPATASGPEEIVVTATLTEHGVRLAPASVSVIDRLELEKLNPQNLLDAVRTVPGITLSPRQVGGRKTLSLRGMEGRHVLTMVDSRRIVATDDVIGHSDYQYGWLPMAAVERIEVIRGPMSTLYGSEALGGVINLITRQPGNHWEGDVSLRSAMTGDNDGRRQGSGSVYVTGPVGERVDLRLSAFSGYTPAVANRSDRRYSEIEGNRSHAGTLGARIGVGERQTIEFNHFQGLEQRFYDDVNRAGVAFANSYDIQRRQTDLAWRTEFDAWHGQLRAYRGHTSIRNQRSNGVQPTRPQELQDDVIDAHSVFERNTQTWTTGGEIRREALWNDGLDAGYDDALHKALFAQNELRIGSALQLTAGLRYDHHEFFSTEFSPRIYLVWEATPTLVVKGGYGHAFKAPTLKQISPNYVGAEGPHTFMGNADIRPETLDSFELGASWQPAGALELQATVFRSRVEDLITYRLLRSQGPRHFYQYDNVDAARIDGIETSIGWRISDAWSWQTSLTALDTEDRRTGKRLEYRPRTSMNSQLDWTGPGGWSLRIGVQRTGEQYSAAGELPAYALWNLRLGKSIGTHAELALAVENLGNLNLAKESPLFGFAERARTVSANMHYRF